MTKRVMGALGALAAMLALVFVVSTGCSLSPTDPAVSEDTTTDDGGEPGGPNSIQPAGEFDPLSW